MAHPTDGPSALATNTPYSTMCVTTYVIKVVIVSDVLSRFAATAELVGRGGGTRGSRARWTSRRPAPKEGARGSRASSSAGPTQWGTQPFNVASMGADTTPFVIESSAGVEGGPAAVVSSKNEPKTFTPPFAVPTVGVQRDIEVVERDSSAHRGLDGVVAPA